MRNMKEIQNQVLEFLPNAINRVIQTYNDFVIQETNLQAKEFSSHHTACKAAISHLESLLKVLKNTSLDISEIEETHQTDISLLIQKAKQDLKLYADREDISE